jgi:hypothetical protein
MREHLWACQVVDSNDFITLSIEHLAECKSSDSAKSVYSNSYCHNKKSSKIVFWNLKFPYGDILYQVRIIYNSEIDILEKIEFGIEEKTY